MGFGILESVKPPTVQEWSVGGLSTSYLRFLWARSAVDGTSLHFISFSLVLVY